MLKLICKKMLFLDVKMLKKVMWCWHIYLKMCLNTLQIPFIDDCFHFLRLNTAFKDNLFFNFVPLAFVYILNLSQHFFAQKKEFLRKSYIFQEPFISSILFSSCFKFHLSRTFYIFYSIFVILQICIFMFLI